MKSTYKIIFKTDSATTKTLAKQIINQLKPGSLRASLLDAVIVKVDNKDLLYEIVKPFQDKVEIEFLHY